MGRGAAGVIMVLLSACVAAIAAGPARAQDTVPEMLARAKDIVAGRCFLCHGEHGEAASELFPRLAGQNADYLAKQLADFAGGRRRSESMQPMVAGLSPRDMRALGLYFSGLPSAPHAAGDAALRAEGRAIYFKGGASSEVQPCAACHGERGHGTHALPRLAGQVAAYLEAQLRQFGRRERTNDNAVMHAVAARMTWREMRAVAEYLSTLD